MHVILVNSEKTASKSTNDHAEYESQTAESASQSIMIEKSGEGNLTLDVY